jgi:hypothetical protein
MKIVCIKGGLGNQMFEYCRYRDMYDRSTEVYLHYVSHLLRQHGGLKLFETFDLAPVEEPLGIRCLAHLLQLCQKLGILRRYCDDTYESSWLIDDFCQDLRYTHFANCYFRFREEIMEAGSRFARVIQQSTYPVALHVRRGDYLAPENIKNFGVCGREYFQNAMRIIRERQHQAVFFIFSDDIRWAKLNLSGHQVFFVENKGAMPDGTELYLMTLCRGHIISNSTFSYWGAYLASQTNAINIYPKQWFRETTWGVPPIFPKGWIGL